jgi:hypothetical protein
MKRSMICRFPDLAPHPNDRAAPSAPFDDSPEQNLSTGTVHTVYSASSALYQRWQADLLAYSHRKVRQPGPLICLLEGADMPEN